MNLEIFDQQMMGLALVLARRGLGTTAPNPAVGAVIADEATGEVIARGATRPLGRPHAETEAIHRAGQRARGATLYVTLEPCAHHGKTPPCADAIIAAGLRRVVVGIEDPDPRTHGEGLQRLRDAGIAVEAGLVADEARWVTRGHVLRITEQRPFVQLKMALSADGTVPRGSTGQPLFVTGTEARAAGQLLRASCDAILVGAGTARDDDPELTCRLPGLASRSPVRVVLSRSLDLPGGLKLITSARTVPVWVFTGADAGAAKARALEEAGVRLFRVPASGAGLSLRAVLAALAQEGITRLLVEGGPSVWQGFASEGLVDEIVLFEAGGAGLNPERTPERTSQQTLQQASQQAVALAQRYAPGLDLDLTAARRAGADVMTTFRVRPSTRDR